MKRTLTLGLLLIINTISYSQDSAFINLGRTQVRKDFVQTIKIKGEDLERIPASCLQAAISSWLYGTLSDSRTLTYVVDGHIIADVNLYSIADIEEVQLVQNAVAQLNGASFQKQLVLVTTKKKYEEGTNFGFTGQTALITKKYYDSYADEVLKGDNSFFHQYLFSARHHGAKINTGVSVGFLRDVNVIVDTTLSEQNPPNIRRFRMNSYFDWNINRHHTLLTKFNVVHQPNDMRLDWDYNVGATAYQDRYDAKGKDLNFETEASLQSAWPKHLSNNITVAYSGLKTEQLGLGTTDYPSPHQYAKSEQKVRTKNFLLNDNFRWQTGSHDWTFSPALNLNYRYADEWLYDYESYNIGANYGDTNSAHVNKFMVTPSFDFVYRKIINLQFGNLFDLGQLHNDVFYPFATLTALMSEMINLKKADWKLYASYSNSDQFFDHAYPLSGYATDKTFQLLAFDPSNIYDPYRLRNLRHPGGFSWRLGTAIGFFRNQLNLAYNVEKRAYMGGYSSTTSGLGYVFYSDTRSWTHDIRFQFHTSENSTLNWLSALHFTSIKNNPMFSTASQPHTYVSYNAGSSTGEKLSWSCGWNNRINYGKLFFGADLLCQFNKTRKNIQGSNITTDTLNLLSVQSAYIGYRLHIKNINNSELYFTSRNPYQNRDYKISMDARSYFGAGFKVVL